MGAADTISLGAKEDSYVTLSRNDAKKLAANVEINDDLVAPINKGDIVGKIFYQVDGKDIYDVPLIALESVEEGSFFSRMFDYIKMFFLRVCLSKTRDES